MSLPGGSTRAQAAAVMDLLGAHSGGAKRRTGWDQVAEQARTAATPSAVISAEFLCRASARQVRHAVTSLQPAQVHVVFMARDLSKVIPAMWQTLMRNGDSITWADYLASVRDDESGSHGRRFWQHHDPRNVLARWESRVPREQVHVVTVPPAGGDPAVLWERFCAVTGVDPDGCALDVSRSNESLGSVEAGLLLRLNGQLRGVRQPTYNRWVKRFIARSVLEKHTDRHRFALPEQEHTWLRPRIEQICEFLTAGGYHLVGDLDDLLPRPSGAVTAPPDDAEPEEMLDMAVEVIAELVRAMDRRGGAAGRPTDGAEVSFGQSLTDRFSRVGRVGAGLRLRSVRPARWRTRR
jgi:hypothetical protein